jgi:hypothetical protein
MAFTQKRLVGPAAMATSATALYTTPASTTTIVKQIMLCNTHTSTATATLHIAAAASVLPANMIFKAISLDPSETVILNLSLVLATTNIISGLASNTGVTITISGIEEA